MFRFAQSIVRHKVGVIAVIAFAVFVFSRDGQDDAGRKANPWSHQAQVAQVSAKKDDGMMKSIAGKAVTAASGYIGEATGIDPAEVAQDSVGNFNKANEEFAKANNRN